MIELLSNASISYGPVKNVNWYSASAVAIIKIPFYVNWYSASAVAIVKVK